MPADFVNGLWELAGALCLSLSCLKAWRAKSMQGVSGWTVLFFFGWGLWNVYFYPSQGLNWSFAGGVALCSMNGLWAYLWWRYGRG